MWKAGELTPEQRGMAALYLGPLIDQERGAGSK
jgi:hypothetical protein